jgi:hypothetical protein
MPLNDPYSWVTYLHVLGVLGFLAAHGASLSVAFKLRGEHERERIRALLDLSGAYLKVMYGSLAVLVVSGVVAGIMGGWFTGSFWIWASVGLVIGIMVSMYYFGTSHFSELRRAVGLPYAIGSRPQPAIDPVSETELALVVAKGRPWALAGIGLGGFGLIAFLMLFKPF